jgi:hypothetical protein
MVRFDAPARISMPSRVRVTGEQLDMPAQVFRQLRVERGAAPEDGDQLVEEQDQAEGGEHLVEMVAVVERAQRQHFDQHADQQRAGEAEHHARRVGAGPLRGGEREVRAHHVERAVREIHEVHDPQHQREARRHQEQRDPQLYAVQQLLEDQGPGHKKGRVGALRK